MDKRWHFGGPYGYEFDCQIIPPVGSGLSSRLESQAAAFLGQLESYRRASNLQSLTWYAQDSAGNFYEYGVRMGRPYAVIVVVGGNPPATETPYQPAIAYLFPLSSATIGNTIRYAAPIWKYVKHPDNRATTHEKFYGRIYGGVADATMYDARLMHYKGAGFLLGGASSFDSAGVANDQTQQTVIGSQTTGHVVAFQDLGTTQQVFVGDLPLLDRWKTFSTYDATDYPGISMTAQGTISAYSVINFCYDKPYVCTFRNNSGVSTIETFRLSAEGSDPALSLVDSISASSADAVDLRGYVDATITMGPAFSRPYTIFSVTGAGFDTGSAIVSTDYAESASNSNGVTAHYTIGFSQSQSVAEFATDCHSYASSISTDIAQVTGTVERSCSADTLFKAAEYATAYEVVRHEDLYSPDNPPSDSSHFESAAYTKMTEDSTFSASFSFVGEVCGLPCTLNGSESFTRSRQIEFALYQTSVTDDGSGGISTSWRGGEPTDSGILGDQDNFLNKEYVRSMQFRRCLFSDRRFGASVVIEATDDINTVAVAASTQTSTGDNFVNDNDSTVFTAGSDEDYISGMAGNLSPLVSNPWFDYIYSTQTVESQVTQDLVLYYGDVEVHREHFYNKVISSTAAVDESHSVDVIESIAVNQGATAEYCTLPQFGAIVSTSQCTACANETGMVVRFIYQDESGVSQQLFIDTHGDNWKTEAGDSSIVAVATSSKMFRV